MNGPREVHRTSHEDARRRGDPSPFRLRRGRSLAQAGAVVALALVILGVTAPPTIQPRPPRVPAAEDVTLRAFAADSPWNTPISDTPEIDPRSAELVSSIAEGPSPDMITSDPTQFSFPVYTATPETPRWDVPCTKYKCTI